MDKDRFGYVRYLPMGARFLADTTTILTNTGINSPYPCDLDREKQIPPESSSMMNDVIGKICGILPAIGTFTAIFYGATDNEAEETGTTEPSSQQNSPQAVNPKKNPDSHTFTVTKTMKNIAISVTILAVVVAFGIWMKQRRHTISIHNLPKQEPGTWATYDLKDRIVTISVEPRPVSMQRHRDDPMSYNHQVAGESRWEN